MSGYLSLAVAVLAVTGSGCASVRSVPDRMALEDDGLVYYLPEKHVSVTLTVTATKHSIAIAETDAFPDPSQRYVARFARNQFGKNKLQLTTNAAGLLDGDSKTITTPQITDVFKGIATSGAWIGNRKRGATEDGLCKSDGTYVLIFDPSEGANGAKLTLCGYSIVTKALGPTPPATPSPSPPGTDYGLYYRRPLPYLVSVIGADQKNSVAQKIVLLPNKDSAIAFLRAPRAIFATSTGTFSFDNGMPTTYEQELDSELLGLVKWPAEVLKAYFAAIGATFDGLKAATVAENDYLAKQNAAAIQAEKTRACLAAIAGGVSEEIRAACGP